MSQPWARLRPIFGDRMSNADPMMSRALLTVSLLAIALPAAAQDNARLDRVERSLKEVRSIVFQGRDTGQPVVIKPAGPDPQVTALEQKVSDLEQTLQRVNGQLDTATHDLDEAKHALADERAASGEQMKSMADRLARLEAVQAAAVPPPPPAVAPPPPAPAEAEAPPPPPAPTRRGRASAATARAQAEDEGVLGGPAVAAPAAPPATEAQSYRAAKALLSSGDYAAATGAFQDYIGRFPSSPRLPEARYWLGETYFIQNNPPEAARAYALALKGWPKTGWAAESTLKLSQSLVQLNRPEQACAALGEFQRRYGAGASAGLKARAEAIRVKAKCGA